MSNQIHIERNLEHQRMIYADNCVKDILSISKGYDIGKNYRSEVLSTGTRIRESGLFQTLVFYSSKIDEDKKERGHFLKLNLHLIKWLIHRDKSGIPPASWEGNKADALDLLSHLMTADDNKAMLYTEEAQALLIWLKRLADARLVTQTKG